MNNISVSVTEYVRSNARRVSGTVLVPSIDVDDLKTFEDNLQSMKRLGINITVENVFDDMVSICLDDSDFDYQIRLVRSDAIVDTIRSLVIDFDEANYVRLKDQWDRSEEYDCF